MIHINTYITSLCSMGEQWSGPNIKADSFEDANRFIEENGMGYLKVEGRLYFSFDVFELN